MKPAFTHASEIHVPKGGFDLREDFDVRHRKRTQHLLVLKPYLDTSCHRYP